MFAKFRAANHDDSKRSPNDVSPNGGNETFRKKYTHIFKPPTKDEKPIVKEETTTDEGFPRELSNLSLKSNKNSSSSERSHSSQIQTSQIMSNNITRLKRAHTFLTPIVDEIISRATSYTHKEFKTILTNRQPICSISYSQYIRAFQASELIARVGRELSAVDFNNPYQVNFAINNVNTITKEDLLQNIERMADRIFIDRDLMKQLVNLHELITDTIEKLKHSLKDISVEGLENDNVRLNRSQGMDDTPLQLMQFDRDTIRKDIAEHFIVIGEPKNTGCYCTDEPGNAKRAFKLNTQRTAMAIKVRDSTQYTKEHQLKAPKTNEKAGKKKCKITRKGSKCSWRSCSPCPSKCRRRRKGARDSREGKHANRLGVHEVYPDQDGLRTCVDDPNMPCRIPIKGDIQERRHSTDSDMHRYHDIEEKSLIIAESDSYIRVNDDEFGEDGARRRSRLDSVSKGSWRRIVKRDKGTLCEEECINAGMGCSDMTAALRNMMQNIADQLLTLKENNIVDFEEKEFEECEIKGVDKEYYTMQEVMYCLETIEQIRKKLTQMKFMEVKASTPPGVTTCCERIYPHVHANVSGIPIIVKISQNILDLLNSGHPNKPSRKCNCKPPTLKNFIKEKFTLAKLINNHPQGRRIAEKRNSKVVMMTVHPMHEDIFGMRANSLLVESAFQERTPDVFQIMDIAESNTSLPYVVNRTSLPNITICRNLNVDLPTLRQQVVNVNVEHPKPRIEHELQNIGLDNLLRAAIPAECCMPFALNRNDADHEPFHASLNSLPLTTSDLQMITDIVDQDADLFCNYPPINYYYYLTTTVQFKFERYTNFQEEVIVIPPICRVYLVYYFAIFKRDLIDHDYYRGVERDKRQSSISGNRKKIKKDRLPPASRHLVSKIFHRIFPSAEVEESEHRHSEHHKTPRKTSHRHKIDKDKVLSVTASKNAVKARRHKKNQRLQTNPSGYVLVQDDLEKGTTIDTYQCPNILNQFAGSTMTVIKKPLKMNLTGNRSSFPKIPDKCVTSKPNYRKKPCYTTESPSFINIVHPVTEMRSSSFFMGNKDLNEIPPLLDGDHVDYVQKCENHREIKGDLGTIYETEEKTLSTKDSKGKMVTTLFDLSYVKDISKNVESEQVIDMFEKSNVEPAQFWSMYFKQRRETLFHGKTQLPDTSLMNFEDQQEVKKIIKPSRIPRPISKWSPPDSTKCKSKSTLEVISAIKSTSSHSTELLIVTYPNIPSQILQADLTPAVQEPEEPEDVPSTYTVPTPNPLPPVARTPRTGGYMTILHPACGCPEVSIFVPCFCGGKGHLQAGITAKHVARLSANTNGRHILLPTSCRLPRSRGVPTKSKGSQNRIRKKNEMRNT